MMMRSEIYDRFDVVVVPFPFTDRQSEKRRPALVLSDETEMQTKIGHSVLAMITSQETPPWPLDVEISDLKAAGLSANSKVRFKIFTLDNRFILKRLGTLSSADQKSVSRGLKKVLKVT